MLRIPILILLINILLFGQYTSPYPQLEEDEKSPDPQMDLYYSRSLMEENEIILEGTIDPDEYRVGPGDVFAFNMLSADGIFTYNLKISPTGEILIPVIGTVFVDQLTLNEAISAVKDRTYRQYQDASIHLALVTLRKFKVLVTGPVDYPGFIVVNPLTRVSDIFLKVNDDPVLNSISARNIRIKRGNELLHADLVKYYMFGDASLNPTVQQGDVIQMAIVREEVGIYGGVQLSDQYEYVQNETLEDLISLAGGLTVNADPTNIEITRFTNDTDRVVIKVESYLDVGRTILQPADHVIIRMKKDYKRQDIVTLKGEVKYPGKYAIDAGLTTIGEIISRAGGLSLRADKTKISVNNQAISQLLDVELERILLIPNEDRSDTEKAYMKARSRILKGQIISASDVYTQTILSFPLQRDDEVNIPPLQEYVEVLGAVLHPGRYPLIDGYDFNNYIKNAGGLTQTATRKKFLIKNSTGQRIPLKPGVRIENGDVIFIAEKLEYNRWERFKDIMTIGGQMAAIIIVIQNAVGK
ncbi:MAG: SLBB domain-containing protein [FCB group bacterium]|nr:SLBB domain-containing protein [FCB group bacterium]